MQFYNLAEMVTHDRKCGCKGETGAGGGIMFRKRAANIELVLHCGGPTGRWTAKSQESLRLKMKNSSVPLENLKACLKLQNVSGNSGYTNKLFIYVPLDCHQP